MEIRAIIINQYAGKEQLTESKMILPELEKGQVLVKVKATRRILAVNSSINFSDIADCF
ncbi:hypothetical protein GCM10019998_14890 [Tetragenococcus solitarius]|uniref:Uncharacterized protein n=1 Tax=Tetragenococcus solitarius TaxID=71453 RepID=A0ABN3Y5K7_9ENTE